MCIKNVNFTKDTVSERYSEGERGVVRRACNKREACMRVGTGV